MYDAHLWPSSENLIFSVMDWMKNALFIISNSGIHKSILNIKINSPVLHWYDNKITGNYSGIHDDKIQWSVSQMKRSIVCLFNTDNQVLGWMYDKNAVMWVIRLKMTCNIVMEL